MFLQNLRAKMSARLSGDREAGFTLIELLVVMLILGILAAIAIPAFFNQRDKATDADAKSAARTAQTAMETYATDNGGVVDESAGGADATVDDLVEFARLRFGLLDGRVGLFDERRVVLGHLVHLADGGIDLVDG